MREKLCNLAASGQEDGPIPGFIAVNSQKW